MKKRLRKKLHLGEYREFGFNVTFTCPCDQYEIDKFLEDFWDAIEINETICCGGGGVKEWHFYVYGRSRASATETDRLNVLTWLEGQSEVTDIVVGPLVDSWWGWK
jgi:uncharacterized protein